MNPGQVDDPWVNFPSVYGLTSVTVHMSFSLPGLMDGLPVLQDLVTCLAVTTFVHVNRTLKLPQGKNSLAYAHC